MMATQTASASVRELERLIDGFLAGRMGAGEFERRYLRAFTAADGLDRSEEEYRALNGLFGDVDAFCGDPALFDPVRDIDEAALGRGAQDALDALRRSRGKSAVRSRRAAG